MLNISEGPNSRRSQSLQNLSTHICVQPCFLAEFFQQFFDADILYFLCSFLIDTTTLLFPQKQLSKPVGHILLNRHTANTMYKSFSGQ